MSAETFTFSARFVCRTYSMTKDLVLGEPEPYSEVGGEASLEYIMVCLMEAPAPPVPETSVSFRHNASFASCLDLREREESVGSATAAKSLFAAFVVLVSLAFASLARSRAPYVSGLMSATSSISSD